VHSRRFRETFSGVIVLPERNSVPPPRTLARKFDWYANAIVSAETTRRTSSRTNPKFGDNRFKRDTDDWLGDERLTARHDIRTAWRQNNNDDDGFAEKVNWRHRVQPTGKVDGTLRFDAL